MKHYFIAPFYPANEQQPVSLSLPAREVTLEEFTDEWLDAFTKLETVPEDINEIWMELLKGSSFVIDNKEFYIKNEKNNRSRTDTAGH